MSMDARVNQLTKEIGQIILQDPRLAHGLWNSFSLVFTWENERLINYGFVYDIKGRAKPFRTDISSEYLKQLQQCLPDGELYWQACRLEMVAFNWEMSWEFEYHHPERLFPAGDLSEMAQDLYPQLGPDQFWCCPLSHDILAKLVDERPHLLNEINKKDVLCMITNTLVKAMRYGLNSRSDLAAFAMTCFEVAPNFDMHPEVREAFARVLGQSGPVWEQLISAVTAESWEKMKRSDFYDGRAWFSEMPDYDVEEVA